MPRLERIRIQGFRRLADVAFEMRPLMVMIGANGAGKTSILDAISLLAASASGRLNQGLNDLGGIADVGTRNGSGEIAFSANMGDPAGQHPLDYSLCLVAKGQSYGITRESLTQLYPGYSQPFIHCNVTNGAMRYYRKDANKLVSPDLDYNPMESALSQVPRMYRPPEEFRLSLGSVAQYHVIDVGRRAPVKLPQPMRPADLPGANGEDLVSFLFNLRESDRDRYECIEDTLIAAFPGFESLSFPPVAAGMLSLTWKEKYFKNPLYIHQLSEGTLRFLWLVSLLQSPGLSAITMIDEPEVSLHPELLSLLADLLREAAASTQVIVATHSDRLIRFLKPSEVMVLDVDEHGQATATWGDALDLDAWLQEYSLDEIWRMGRLGGRP